MGCRRCALSVCTQLWFCDAPPLLTGAVLPEKELGKDEQTILATLQLSRPLRPPHTLPITFAALIYNWFFCNKHQMLQRFLQAP